MPVTNLIRFTERCLVVRDDDGNGHRRYSAVYEAGDCVELPESSCQRFIRRGKAVRVETLPTAPPPVKTVAPGEIVPPPPEDLGDARETVAGFDVEIETAVESSGAGVAGEEESDAEPEPVGDSDAVDGSHRRPRGRRTQPDP
jgi:hypothetical protein